MSTETIEARLATAPKVLLLAIAVSAGAIGLVERDPLAASSAIVTGLTAAVGFGYKAQLSGARITGSVNLFGLRVRTWNINLRRARVDYLLPAWLGPMSVLVVFGGRDIFVVSPAHRHRAQIVRHILRYAGRSAA